jgi:hypothetical protein
MHPITAEFINCSLICSLYPFVHNKSSHSPFMPLYIIGKIAAVNPEKVRFQLTPLPESVNKMDFCIKLYTHCCIAWPFGNEPPSKWVVPPVDLSVSNSAEMRQGMMVCHLHSMPQISHTNIQRVIEHHEKVHVEFDTVKYYTRSNPTVVIRPEKMVFTCNHGQQSSYLVLHDRLHLVGR